MSVGGEWARAELAALDSRGLRRKLEPLESPQGPVVTVRGARLINFSSNDYLGLSNHPRLVQATQAALARFGVGSGASRLVVGDSLAHHSLEQKLAHFEHAEAALLFNSGYAANVGVLSALCGKEDVVFSDALNHASLIDGARLSRARTVVYPHGNVEALDALMSAHPGRRQVVCTDAVFSMDGDAAPLTQLVEVCARHGAALLVDEAHATGVLGPRGEGLCEQLGVSAQVDARMGTLGKALGCFGAYVVADAELLSLLVHRARSLVFSTSLPPALCAAAEEALAICQSEPERRLQLHANIQRFAEGLGVAPPPSAIFPVHFGSAEEAVAASQRLREKGILAKAIRPPTVPPGTSRLRFALSAGHTFDQIDTAIAELKRLR